MPTKKSLTNFFKRLLFVVQVEGESGWPLLIPGKRYLASNLLRPRQGDFIVFRNPASPSEILIKQLTSREGKGYRVESVRSWGTSSGQLGVIPRALLLGKLLGRRQSSFVS